MKTFNRERKNVEKLKLAIYNITYISSAYCPRLTSLYQKMLRHSKFYAMIGQANHFMIIFLNINLNVRNERKMVMKLRGCTYKITHIVAANIPRLPHLVQTYS